VLMGDACCRPSIAMRSHDLCASNTRGALSEIASYHERD
jgi:hypothetical protein